MVDLLLATKELLLAGRVGEVTTDLVTVLLGLEERSQVHTGPHLLTGKLTIENEENIELVLRFQFHVTTCWDLDIQLQGFGSGRSDRRELLIAQDIPLLASTLEVLIGSPDHNQVHTGHVDPWLETASGEIPLEMRR